MRRYLIAAGWGAGIATAWLMFWLIFLTITQNKTVGRLFFVLDFVYRWTERWYASLAELRLVGTHAVIPFVAFQLFSHALFGIGLGLVTQLIVDTLRGRCNKEV